MAVSVLGTGSFIQIGQPKWTPGGLNSLDTMELTYQGIYSKLAAFRGGYTQWQPSTIDSNMFLESFPDDGNEIKPKVTLRFIGLRGGRSDSASNGFGSRLVTVSTTDGENQLSVLYRSPYAKRSQILRSASDPGSNSPIGTPIILERRSGNHIPSVFRLQAQAQYFIARATAAGATPEEIAAIQAALDAQLAALEGPINSLKAIILAYFNHAFTNSTQTEFEADPLVPGRYWLCSSIRSATLLPF